MVGALAVGAVLSLLFYDCTCQEREGTPRLSSPATPPPDLGPEVGPPRFAAPPPREPGPPRPESRPQIAAAAQEAKAITSSLIGGGVPSREAASIADMRGYRLYRRRSFGQALAWFRAAIKADPGFELSLYNGARCAALLGDPVQAQTLLAQLARLDTPLARARLELARSDPDLLGARAQDR